jgi:DNA-binding IclR family transcriptional regulator
LKELEKVRKQGFAIDNEESFAGIRCVAAPIKDDKGKIIAAISATVPKQRMTKQRMVEIKKHIIGTVSLISNQIKYTE